MRLKVSVCFFFFFNDTATTEIYTLSLHDALPIYLDADVTFVRKQGDNWVIEGVALVKNPGNVRLDFTKATPSDRKSTRLNSSHQIISYAVFCLKKKKIAKQ